MSRITAHSLIGTYRHVTEQFKSDGGFLDDVGYALSTINNVPLLSQEEERELTTSMYEKKRAISQMLFRTGLAIESLLTLINTPKCQPFVKKKENHACNITTLQKIHDRNKSCFTDKSYDLEASMEHASALTEELGLRPKYLLQLTSDYVKQTKELEKAHESGQKSTKEIRKTVHVEIAYLFEHSHKINQQHQEYIIVRNRFVEANRKLAVNLAKRSGQKDLADKIAMANEGLIIAADNFDSTLGFKFSTYASWWIVQRINSYCKKDHLIHLPFHCSTDYHNTIQRLNKKLGRDPTQQEIEKCIAPSILTALKNPISLDRQNKEEDMLNSTLTSQEPPPEKNAETKDLVNFTSRILDNLSQRHKYIISAHFGIGQQQKTLEQIGEELGLTRERVRQLEAQAIEKLRKLHQQTLETIAIETDQAHPANGLVHATK